MTFQPKSRQLFCEGKTFEQTLKYEPSVFNFKVFSCISKRGGRALFFYVRITPSCSRQAVRKVAARLSAARCGARKSAESYNRAAEVRQCTQRQKRRSDPRNGCGTKGVRAFCAQRAMLFLNTYCCFCA